MDDLVLERPLYSRIALIFAYTGALLQKNRRKHGIVFFFRSLFGFRQTTRWIAFLEKLSQHAGLGHPPLELVRKAFGSYFTMGRTRGQRVELLEQHYRFASARLSAAVFRALWAGETVALGTIRGKKHGYRIWLRRADQCGTRHEGEWTVGFESEAEGLVLCRLTFIFASGQGGGPTVAIGGLQGTSAEGAKSAIITATRDLGGLRPKDALLLAVAGMAEGLGSPSLLAIDNRSHPINRRARRRRMRMRTDYDQYWRERGGEPGGPFGFVIPLRDTCEMQSGSRRDQAKLAFLACGRQLLDSDCNGLVRPGRT